MHDVAYAPESEAQLVALYFHIAAAASPEIAANDTDAIVQQCETLKTFPKRSARGGGDIRPGLRVFGFRRRVSVACEITDTVVTILGIACGGQKFESALNEWRQGGKLPRFVKENRPGTRRPLVQAKKISHMRHPPSASSQTRRG